MIIAGTLLAGKYFQTYDRVTYKGTEMFCRGQGNLTVLLLHGGYPSTRASKEILFRMGKLFKGRVCAVNYALSGFGGDELQDVLNAIDSTERAVLIGKSHGAYLALLASSYRNVSAVVEISGPTDLLTMNEFSLENLEIPLSFSPLIALTVRECGGNPDQVPECYAHRSPLYRAEYIQSPVLVIHGKQDSVVPIEQAYEMEGELKRYGKQVEMYYPNATHLGIENREDVIHIMCEFLSRQVGTCICTNC